MKLALDYYLESNVITIAKDLIGKVLVTKINARPNASPKDSFWRGSYGRGKITSGIICETEAYNGVIDKASHSYGGRRTPRNETMYANGGVAYIYLCYGIHHLFNVVTNVKDTPHAVLIRGIYPLDGVEEMLKRKKIDTFKKNIGIGPGNVSTCLGLHISLNKTSLQGNKIWIEDRAIEVDKKEIVVGPRVGVDYAGEDAKLPYRFQYWF